MIVPIVPLLVLITCLNYFTDITMLLCLKFSSNGHGISTINITGIQSKHHYLYDDCASIDITS